MFGSVKNSAENPPTDGNGDVGLLAEARRQWDEGQSDLARQTALAALDPLPSFRTNQTLVDIAKSGAGDFSLSVARELEVRSEGLSSGSITLLEVYLALEKLDDVAALVEQLCSSKTLSGGDVVKLINLSFSLARAGEWALATIVIKTAADTQLGSQETGWEDVGSAIFRWNKLAEFCESEGHTTEALFARNVGQSYRAKDYVDALLNHADAYFDAGYVDDALTIFARACRLAPENSSCWMMRIKCLSQCGKYDEVRNVMEHAVYGMEEQPFVRQLYGRAEVLVPSGLSELDAIVTGRIRPGADGTRQVA